LELMNWIEWFDWRYLFRKTQPSLPTDPLFSLYPWKKKKKIHPTTTTTIVIAMLMTTTMIHRNRIPSFSG
jgi:hypothetical protein